MSEPLDGIAEAEKARTVRRGRVNGWTAFALAVFLLLALLSSLEVWRAGIGSSALASGSGRVLDIVHGDVIFEAWLVARNGRTLVRRPTALFDTEHCAPAAKTLTLGIPMITMGLLAAPVALVTPNPALAYNFSTLMLWIASALAMFLLVRDWTGSAAAGIVAGSFFAFGAWRVGLNAEHPSVYDIAWMVFALYFAQRLSARGRWRDAVGLALACSLQIAASMYPLAAAALFSPPFALWLLARDRLRKVRPSQIAFVAISIGVTAYLVLGPYLDARNSGTIGARTTFFFLPWSAFLPGRTFFLGWAALLLAALGLCIPRKDATPAIQGDPRWALILGALVVSVIAAGPLNNWLLEGIWDEPPIRIPDFYSPLTELIPGLDSIRVVFRLGVVMLVTLCILSGIGSAWLIRVVPLRTPVVGCALIGIAVLTVLFASHDRVAVEVAADPGELSFFESLEKLGNQGPILELPLTKGLSRSMKAPKHILLSAYHRRRVSSCFGSYRGSGRAELEELVDQLPDRSAARALRELGFTTVVLREPKSRWTLRFQWILKRRPAEGLSLLLDQGGLKAYELRS